MGIFCGFFYGCEGWGHFWGVFTARSPQFEVSGSGESTVPGVRVLMGVYWGFLRVVCGGFRAFWGWFWGLRVYRVSRGF